MSHLQLVGFPRSDQRRDELLRVEEVDILVHQAVEDQQTVRLARELVRVAEHLESNGAWELLQRFPRNMGVRLRRTNKGHTSVGFMLK